MYVELGNYTYDKFTVALCLGFKTSMAEQEDIIRYEMIKKCVIGGSLTWDLKDEGVWHSRLWENLERSKN